MLFRSKWGMGKASRGGEDKEVQARMSDRSLVMVLAVSHAPTDVSLPVLVALLCGAAPQVLFCVFTYPANSLTEN